MADHQRPLSEMPDTDIHRLDPATVERIAAGEVVERPASAVKELLENSLDADASRVRVVVERGGIDHIRVTDDGVGMSEEGVRTAVEKHTTSKIDDIDDVEAGLGTLGFRGEALSSIGAISRLTIRTKPRGSDRGTELHLEGGSIEAVEPAGCPEGTTVEVDDLFYNVPARRKYLSTETTEFSHVNDVATGYALANPNVAISLEHNDWETFATMGQGDLEEATLAVYGREVAEAMLPISTESLPEGPLDELHGLISHPETTRAGPEYLRTYVNGRYVSATTVRDAVLDAYGDQLAPDRFPFAVLFCELSGAEIDVNVHPRKREIRFADDQELQEQVHAAIRTALLDHGLLRSSAPRGRSAPEQATIDPGSDEPSPKTPESATVGGEAPAHESTGEQDIDTGHEAADTGEQDADTGHEAADADSRSPSGPESGESASPTTAETDRPQAGPDPQEIGPKGEEAGAAPPDAETAASDAAPEPQPPQEGELDSAHSSARFTAPAEQATLDGDQSGSALKAELNRLPPLRVFGQLQETYIVAEAPEGLVLVDQHAADERVNYERLRERFAGGAPSQTLASPVELDLTAGEAALFETEECAAALDRLGFEASVTEGSSVEVTAVPEIVAGAAAPELLRDALAALAAGDHAAETVDSAGDELLADLACHPSLTGNTSLTEGSIVDLLEALDDCENPYACPHGRPVVIELSQAELDERFERDYPGHAGRREG
jgi:DNA mismatch repair protein MutL